MLLNNAYTVNFASQIAICKCLNVNFDSIVSWFLSVEYYKKENQIIIYKIWDK